MGWEDRVRCAACGLLICVTVGHECAAASFGDERPFEIAIVRPVAGDGELVHDHPEFAVRAEVFARQPIAVGTTSELMPPGEQLMSNDVVLSTSRRRSGWYSAYYDTLSSPAPLIHAALEEAQRAVLSGARS